MDKQLFERLLEKYLVGDSTAGETRQLFRALEQEENRLQWARAIDEYFAASETGIPGDPAVREILQARLTEAIRRADAATPIRRSIVWRYAAAAAVLLAITATWIITRRPSFPAAIHYANDVAPGRNKAILTLAGGRQIVLDDSHTGHIAAEGNVNIVKLDSGRVAYHESGQRSVAITYNTIATPRGGQYQLTMTDGTKVWLDAASTLRFPTAFTGQQREVELTGQAYFEVAHRDHMPFHVRVTGAGIEDLGTHFNVQAYADEPVVKTTLLEGSVRITGAGAAASPEPGLVLKPGQQAEQQDGKITLVPDADPDQAIAWKNGRFDFDGPLSETMRQVARWYDVDLQYQGNIANARFVVQISRQEKISEVLKMMEMTQGVHFTIEGRKIVIKP
jgi:transmembrane sensor